MKKLGRAFLVIAAITLVGVGFQNCGQLESPLLSSQSRSSLIPFSSLSAPHRPKEIIIKMKDANWNSDLYNWALANGLVLENEWPNIHQSNWSWAADVDVNEMENMLGASDIATGIDFVEPNYLLNHPGDELVGAQTFSEGEVSAILAAPGDNSQTAAPIGATNVWSSLSTNGAPVTVAVIDTGVQVDHPVFTSANAIWVNSGEIPNDGIDNDGNGFIDDVNGWDFVDKDNTPNDLNGHGTHCAGVVLGVGQDIFANNPPPARVRIMALKFLGANGGGDTADGISAIYYAANNGAHVLSNSWGGGGRSLALERALAHAYNLGLSVAAAAGNDDSNNDSRPVYPANYPVPNMLSVLASTDNDTKASFSNFANSSVNIAAPGVNILSTYPTSRFARLSGTSMATPFIAGTAALMKYNRNNINGFEVKQIIVNQADNAPALNGLVRNQVRLNTDAAVTTAGVANLDGQLPNFALSGKGSASEEASGGGGCGMVSELPPPSGPSQGLLLALFLLPFLLSLRLRSNNTVLSHQ